MEQERDEQVIYLKDLLFAAAYQWRRILLVALAFAFVLGGFQVARHLSGSKQQDQTLLAQYERELADITAEIARLQEQVQNQSDYLDSSILMALDPYGFYSASTDIYVQSNYQIMPGMSYQNPDITIPILQAYCRSLTGAEVVNTVADALNMNGVYLSEVINASAKDEAVGLLNVTVLFPTEEGAMAILEQVCNCIPGIQAQINDAIGMHSIHTISKEVGSTIDPELVNRKATATKQLQEFKDSLKKSQAALEALTPPTDLSVTTTLKSGILSAILGGILGGGLVAFCAWVVHISGGKVYSTRTLKCYTGIKILGCIPAPGVHRNAIDRWLRKLEDRATDADNVWTALAAANVRNYCAGIHKLLVIGDSDNECRELVCEALKKAGVQAITCGSLLRDPQVLEALPDCDGVLLAEKCGCSRYTGVLQEMEAVQDQDKKLLGCILLDG